MSAEHLEGVDAIVHSAAYVKEWGTRDDYWQANVEGTSQLLDVAQCLRDQGLDVDDPDLSDGLAGAGGPAGIFGAGFDPNDPANQDAIEACRGLFTGFGQGGS